MMHRCATCSAPSVRHLCPVCRDITRDAATICVVADLTDLLAIEASGTYRGRYHVLHGAIEPRDGSGATDLHVDALLARVRRPEVTRVILALKATRAGEVTAQEMQRALERLGVEVTRR